MNVLGMDTSTAATSVCVLRDDGQAFAVDPRFERLFEPPGHSRELMPAVAEAMERAGIVWDGLDAVAVGVGPGTFTGLRIGVATARALAHAAGVPLHPVSSLAALAAGIDAPQGVPLIDAKRGEVFGALYEGGRELVAPFVAFPDEAAGRVGERAHTALAAGDGSVRFRSVLEAEGVHVAPEGSELHVVRALHVCRLATSVAGESPEAVFPNYLREPDAVPSQ
ncbi:MAG: tRNA threonylcarbamoyladenosine biosynthesis protein TsaB [Thermoleophilaceae bacterium]|nr:tRNA threonylcarbamoyladenosine biosynthesis protein TsaB [Thermoleophilaceae bacterium]